MTFIIGIGIALSRRGIGRDVVVWFFGNLILVVVLIIIGQTKVARPP